MQQASLVSESLEPIGTCCSSPAIHWLHAKLGVLASWLPKKSVQKMRGMCECEENLSRFIKCQMYSNVKSLSFLGDVTSVSKILKSSQVNLMLEDSGLGACKVRKRLKPLSLPKRGVDA